METPKKTRRGAKNRDIPASDLPNKARKLRLEANLTLRELAKIIGVHVPTLSEYELHGRGGRSFVYKLADYFKLDPRDLESR